MINKGILHAKTKRHQKVLIESNPARKIASLMILSRMKNNETTDRLYRFLGNSMCTLQRSKNSIENSKINTNFDKSKHTIYF